MATSRRRPTLPRTRADRRGSRRADTASWTALLPLGALVPGWLLAMAAIWLPLHYVVAGEFWMFAVAYLAAGVLLFVRPFQRVVLTRLLGARPLSPHEQTVVGPVWNAVTQSVHSSPRRYVLAAVDDDEVNAYACGGHLVVVTSYAISTLDDRELAGVLAHELSHHLGLHTVALTMRHWLSLPVLLLARIGFFLQNVAEAATGAFGQRSRPLTAAGTAAVWVLRVVGWAFLATILASNALANAVGRRAEFEADRRAVDLGYGPSLAAALRRFVSAGLAVRPTGWRAKAFASHPPERTRIARIEAMLRSRHPAAHRPAGR